MAGLAAGVAVASALRAVPAGPVIETLTVMGSLWMNALRMYLTAGCALAAVVTGVLSLATIVTRWSAPCGSEAVMGAAGSHAS